uniref:putative bifunctional diguanylate cyclase/phosphodiesterase n=1 Tax=uncultured Croceicoccus sp. TaxID=1295329 RepID=UPI0026101199
MRNFREEARLDALHQLKLLDTPASESFDRITRMASQIFDLPIAAISLTDRDRQWFKSRVGIDHWTIPREKAPCAEVAEATRPLVIKDFLADPGYADSLLARNGTRFYAGAPLITSEGYGLGSLCVLGTEPREASTAELRALTDLAAMVMTQIELQHAFGRIDPVSGLPNRTQFRDDLIDLTGDQPGDRRFAVVVDLARDDQVGKMMRVLGSGRVDEMVREAALALREALVPTRSLYQVGATQFAFLSPAGVGEAAYMKMLQTEFERMRASSSVRFVTSLAVGVSPFTIGVGSADDILRGAVSAAQDARSIDEAISLYSASRDRTHRRQYGLLQDFGEALEATDQLRLVFQPRIDLATGQCVGAEALLRWRHPKLGEVSPAEFIPLVEQTSLARALTQWVLDAALDHLSTWVVRGIGLKLSINISAANLAEIDFIQRIQLGLLKRHLRTDQLEIELTESTIMDQPDQALGILRELASIGICVAIDDFGTGQSSLAYLQKLPAQVVKIDQAFVRDLVQNHGPDFDLVETMINLGHKLGYRVVAEGVETAEAAEILALVGCEEAQGFLFARPMEARQFEGWLTASRVRGQTLHTSNLSVSAESDQLTFGE